ncbi:MAG: hypothetical protein KDC87_04225 [Planctomycetes bacterium]|nr:hypothetical protein [Planctomycetota bacterium]
MTRPVVGPLGGVACAAVAVALLGAGLTAQIDRINHRQWAALESQRRDLLAVAKDLPRAKIDAIAAALTQNTEAVPQLTLARARALAVGVAKPDAHFLFRAGLQLLAMPEVVSGPRFDHVAVTLYAPHTTLAGELPAPRKFAFQVSVTDQAGKTVWTGVIPPTEEIRTLREFRATVDVPTKGWPDGTYHVVAEVSLDGKAPRAFDLPVQTSFAVLTGYAERAAFFRLASDVPELRKELAGIEVGPRAVLIGAADHACRAWYGVPGVDPSHAVRDLLRAETILANVRAKRPPLHGLTGAVDFGVATHDDQIAFVNARLPEGGVPARGSERWTTLAKRPLLLVIARAPSFDHEDRRPSYPPYALPGYLAASLQLVAFDRERHFQLVVVESPGRMPNTRRGLVGLVKHLPALLPFDPQRIVVVGEGRGARAAVILSEEVPDAIRGLVLVHTSGGLATPALRKLRDLPILAIPGYRRVGADSIERLKLYARHAGKTNLRVLDDRRWPWPLALPLAAREVEAFARAGTQ